MINSSLVSTLRIIQVAVALLLLISIAAGPAPGCEGDVSSGDSHCVCSVVCPCSCTFVTHPQIHLELPSPNTRSETLGDLYHCADYPLLFTDIFQPPRLLLQTS